jgi:quinol monooxygenase YgiN
MGGDKVLVLITMQAQPGQEARMVHEMKLTVAQVVAHEADCLSIRIHQDPDDASKLMLYEHWTSRAAYTGPHMQTPHIKSLLTRAPEFLAGPASITFWRLEAEVARP